ncbi:glyoxalase [Calothrix sp. 336/3]|nr:glyoxalase [Calothrix sp. 336/3]
MSVQAIPEGYHTVTPYLIVEGTESLIEFLKQGFAATEVYRVMHPDGSIMHAELKIGDSFVMMSEAREDFQAIPSMIHLYVENADVMYERAIGAGAISVMEPKDEFYGDRAALVKDPAGGLWWIATHQENVSPEELEKRRVELFCKQ